MIEALRLWVQKDPVAPVACGADSELSELLNVARRNAQSGLDYATMIEFLRWLGDEKVDDDIAARVKTLARLAREIVEQFKGTP